MREEWNVEKSIKSVGVLNTRKWVAMQKQKENQDWSKDHDTLTYEWPK